MVSPVTSGIQQQFPTAGIATQQPGISTGTPAQRTEREERLESTSTQGGSAARSNSTQTRDYEERTAAANDARAQDSGGVSASTSRGTALDITV